MQKKKRKHGYNPKMLLFEAYDYGEWLENEESSDKDKSFENEESADKEESTNVPPMPALEGDEEEIKEGKGLKILTPNQLSTMLPILLRQIKAGKHSNKL